MRASTSASQANGSMSLSLAVMISVVMAAARSAPRSVAGEQPCPAAKGKTAQCPFGGIVREANPAIPGEAGEAIPALEHIVDGFGHRGRA